MEAPARLTGRPRGVDESAGSAAVMRWVETWADHLRKRFNSRALVNVRIGGAEPVTLSHIYAIEGGGLVLVTPCDHEHEGHEHEGPEHHRASPAPLQPRANAKPPEAHEDAAAPHDHEAGAPPHHHGATPADPNAGGERPDEAAGHTHGDEGDCPGGVELWLASPEQAVFEARSLEAGKLCTGLGYLGLSRTPVMLIARATEPPPKKDHHERVDF